MDQNYSTDRIIGYDFIRYSLLSGHLFCGDSTSFQKSYISDLRLSARMKTFTYQLLFITIAAFRTIEGLMQDQFTSELQRLANDILGVNKFQTYQVKSALTSHQKSKHINWGCCNLFIYNLLEVAIIIRPLFLHPRMTYFDAKIIVPLFSCSPALPNLNSASNQKMFNHEEWRVEFLIFS